MLTLSSKSTPRRRRLGTAALAIASLGAVTVASVEPAQAFRGGGFGFRPVVGGFGHGFRGFRGGRFGYRGWGGYRFGHAGWGYRRFGWGPYGYRRFGWGYPALGFGLGFGLASAGYAYGYPDGGYAYEEGAYEPGVDRGDDGPRRHPVCDPRGLQTHLSKRYC